MVAPGDWTSGFPAGAYWLLYEHTGDPAWLAAAEAQTAPLGAVRMAEGDMADVGFIIETSFGNGHRLTGKAAYQPVLLDGAAYLASRFNQTVGATLSWDFGDWMFPVIVDNVMNLEILFHAAALGGEARFADIGIAHALTTRANHFRPDGGSFHLVDFNSGTGAVISRGTYAGLADGSVWARGQAWALYGYTMAYRETRDQRFLDHATLVARYFTESPNMPADGIPYFDFDVPQHPEVTPLRDASAGAIAASGLLELAKHSDGAGGATGPAFRAFAVKALRTLSSPAYRATPGTNGNFLLIHGEGAYTFDVEVDVGLIYADYYYIEALLRCRAE
jgi:unsaturated chondroitin disaccharide hydrolase